MSLKLYPMFRLWCTSAALTGVALFHEPLAAKPVLASDRAASNGITTQSPAITSIQVWSKIASARLTNVMIYPNQSVQRNETGSVGILLMVRRDGTIESVRDLGTVRSGALRRAALASVARLNKLPALPPNTSDDLTPVVLMMVFRISVPQSESIPTQGEQDRILSAANTLLSREGRVAQAIMIRAGSSS
jgi:TonB family protein